MSDQAQPKGDKLLRRLMGVLRASDKCCTDGIVCCCNVRKCKCKCPGCWCG